MQPVSGKGTKGGREEARGGGGGEEVALCKGAPAKTLIKVPVRAHFVSLLFGENSQHFVGG